MITITDIVSDVKTGGGELTIIIYHEMLLQQSSLISFKIQLILHIRLVLNLNEAELIKFHTGVSEC